MDGKSGGIDKYLLNFLDTVYNGELRIDFLTNEIDENLKQELEKYHARLYAIPNLRHPAAQYRRVRRIIKEGGYDAVYFNISTAIDCIAAIAAKHEQVKRRMIHSHSSGNDCESSMKRHLFDIIHKICRLFLWKYATEYYGCSEKAGEWLFPKRIVHSERFTVVFNAVERERFAYNEQTRKEVRKELEIEDRFVIGHAGNFCYQKNHAFLIKVFAEIYRRNSDACLILAGDGVCFEAVKRQVKEAGLEGAVLFLGRRNDVERLYQAMDVFVLPSNFEGLPIAGVEAQSAGLPCVMSSRITKESRITKQCRFLSFEQGVEAWAEEIISLRGIRKEAEYLPEAGQYDLAVQKEQLKKLVQF